MTVLTNDSPKSRVNKSLPVLKKNYNNNLQSDYTEKIEELDKNFNYQSNSDCYWSEPQQSILYGTPLYQQASLSQKIALNHLHWLGSYKIVADSEMEVIFYNTITADCLRNANKDYEFIANLLAHESEQERHHIHCFYKVNYHTLRSLIGAKNWLKADLDNFSFASNNFQVLPYLLSSSANAIGNIFLKKQKENYSQNLASTAYVDRSISLPTTSGFFNGYSGNRHQSMRELLPVGWASYPFLASNFYAVRYMANLSLKNGEFEIHKYYQKLRRNNQFIPAPTEISHYHFLDEAFHTTTSLFMGRDFYKYLPEPSAYEKIIANLSVLQIQYENLNSLSGIISNRFESDKNIIKFVMKILQSPVFDMSQKEAIYWLEKCLCYEHEGFHVNLKIHNHLLSSLREFLENLDYLWPINREVRLMASGGSIENALKNNIKGFKNFSRTIQND